MYTREPPHFRSDVLSPFRCCRGIFYIRQPSYLMRPQRGISLLEVLIAMLVLAIGLLGLAGLQALALQHNHNAYLRTQATNHSYDILDRMRANRNAALNGAYTTALDPDIACDPSLNPSGDSLAARDIAQWLNNLACQMPNGAGDISGVNNGEVTITLCWRERTPDDTDPEDNDAIPEICGNETLAGFSYTARL